MNLLMNDIILNKAGESKLPGITVRNQLQIAWSTSQMKIQTLHRSVGIVEIVTRQRKMAIAQNYH